MKQLDTGNAPMELSGSVSGFFVCSEHIKISENIVKYITKKYGIKTICEKINELKSKNKI